MCIVKFRFRSSASRSKLHSVALMTVLSFLSSRQFLWRAAGCAADLGHVLGVAGADGARAVAPSHGTRWEVEGG